eukprot:scaffold43448_cov51-Cyclotella_meneghiniana.AAC.2
MQTIEVRDEYNGALDRKIEITTSIFDIALCPRATIRFFHRRNSCDCLQEMYYNLKETTKRTSWCWNCEKVEDIKVFKECTFCKLANYCSYECAVAHWPGHKEQCKEWRKDLTQKEKSESFNDIEAVD